MRTWLSGPRSPSALGDPTHDLIDQAALDFDIASYLTVRAPILPAAEHGITVHLYSGLCPAKNINELTIDRQALPTPGEKQVVARRAEVPGECLSSIDAGLDQELLTL